MLLLFLLFLVLFFVFRVLFCFVLLFLVCFVSIFFICYICSQLLLFVCLSYFSKQHYTCVEVPVQPPRCSKNLGALTSRFASLMFCLAFTVCWGGRGRKRHETRSSNISSMAAIVEYVFVCVRGGGQRRRRRTRRRRTEEDIDKTEYE